MQDGNLENIGYTQEYPHFVYLKTGLGFKLRHVI